MCSLSLLLVTGLLALGALDATAAPGDPAVELDGGCVVYLEALPSHGTGCHIHYTEPNPDGGDGDTETIAVVDCDQAITVCGEPVRCRCPEK